MGTLLQAVRGRTPAWPFCMSIAELNTLYTAAVAAMDSADWDTAITKLMAMQARLASTPNITRALGGGGSQGIAWNAASLKDLIAECRRNKAAVTAAASETGPWQTTKVTYKRATT